MAGLKHLTEQDAALLLGKRFSERIQDTCVPGIEGVWALRGKGRAVDSLPPQCLLPDVVGRLLEWPPGPPLLVLTSCVVPCPAVREGRRPGLKPTEDGKGGGRAWLCVGGCTTALQPVSSPSCWSLSFAGCAEAGSRVRNPTWQKERVVSGT